MNQTSFDFSEFIQKDEEKAEVKAPAEDVEVQEEGTELDVHKAVVEELAAEKVELNEKMAQAEAELLALKTKCEKLERELEIKNAEVFGLKSELENVSSNAKAMSAQLAAALSKEEDQQVRNPNALALLDREVELPDRFPGETRDHVLEVVREARDKAEAEGRLRRAQLLESVLVANEPNGTLATRRERLAKLFVENANIISGPVLEELNRLGISHKNGEQYLLPSEIMLRTY